jgi:peptidoglycan/xylan/chitin deacetylase (PgdA/CDA1 family)
MYHAVQAAGDACAGQDPHYTVPSARFAGHLDLALRSGARVGCARDLLATDGSGPAVALTFDDGHLSHYVCAFPLLAARGLRADFFVNPARVGTAGFASWSQLRAMAAAGMSIQSHGYDHRYFDELAPAVLREDLQRARGEIEAHIGQPVTLLAPPGGRAPAGLAALARATGYRHVLGSRPGRIAGRTGLRVLPRVPVTADLDDARLRAWLDGSPFVSARAQMRHLVLGSAKRLLGNRRYEQVRARLLGQPHG